jgi:PAS domain S-box-containing protein
MSVQDIARLFEAHRSPVIGLHEDGRCAFANPALRAVLGEDADALPDPAAFLTAPDPGTGILSWIAGEETGFDGPDHPVLLRRADGEEVPAGARGAWFASPDGTRLFIITLAVATDIGDGDIAHPLLHAINEAVIIAGTDRQILYANEAACRRYGYGEKEFRHLTLDAIVSPSSQHTPASIHAGLFAKKTDFFENEHITRKGRVIPVEVSTRAIVYRGIPAIMSVSRDITYRREQERMQQVLRESEETYRVIFESAGDAIFITDMDGAIVRANDRMARMLGYQRSQLAGMRLDDLLAPDDPGTKSTFTTIPDAGSLLYLASLRAADGTLRPVEILSHTMPHGGKTAIFSIARDISPRRALEEQLRLSEEMYRGIFANSGVAILIIDRSDEILLGNAEAEDLLAAPPGGLAGKVWMAFVDDPHLLGFAEEDEVPGGFEHFRIRNYETECITCSGERVPCILSVSSIPGAGRYIVTLQDLRENRAMTASIKERQQLLDGIFRSAHDGLILLDDRQRVLIWSKGAERITGYAADAMAGTIFEESPVFGEGGRLFGEDLRELLVPQGDAEGGRRNRADLRILPRRGGEKECEMTVSFVEQENGTSTLCILRDVSRQKAILDALTRNEEYLRLVIDSADLGTWDWRIDSGLIAVSPDMFDILNVPYTAEWVPVSTLDAWIHPDDRVRWEEGMHAFARGGQVKGQTEFRMTAADGHIVWFAIEGSAAEFGGDGTPRRVVGILRDITEEKQAEHALREANKKLSVLSGITRHDILNQIQGLLFYSEEIILGDYTPEEQRKMAEKILAASETINRQITFTRTYENLGAEPAEWQDLGAILDEIKGEAPPAVTCTIAVPAIEVFADRLFCEVFRSICANIAAHAAGATKVAVTFEEREGSGVLVIADDGCGISAAKKEKIFAHNPAKPGNSLFLAREIAGVTGIRLTETGTEGEGAVFEIAIPKAGYRFMSGH